MPDPVRGGTFVQALAKPATEEPALAATVSERVIADQLYDGLTTWDARSLETRPALAQRWESNADNTQWTFELRDAKAGNGEAITANDVKTSLERVARKSAGSPYADLLAAVKGFSDFAANDAVPALEGVVVVDAKTVRIDLNQPAAEFDRMLGNPAFSIVHRAADGSAVTTGPFKVKERPDPNRVVLERSEGSNAYLDGVDMRYFPDVNAAYDAFVAGQAQWTPVSPERANDAGQKYGTHLFRPSLRTVSLGINTTNPKLADPRFRQALVRGIDRRAVVEKMGIADTRQLNGIIPHGVPGAQSGGCGPDCTYDVAAAQALVKQVFGDAPAPGITLDFAGGPPFNDAAINQIVADLAKIGVAATPRPTPAGEYASVTVRPDRELFQTSWSAAYPSPDAFLPPLFTSSTAANVFALNDPAIDVKLGEAQREKQASKRTEKWREIERDVMSKYPVVPLAQFAYDSVAGPDVRGLDPLPTGNFDIGSVWLNPPAR